MAFSNFQSRPRLDEFINQPGINQKPAPIDPLDEIPALTPAQASGLLRAIEKPKKKSARKKPKFDYTEINETLNNYFDREDMPGKSSGFVPQDKSRMSPALPFDPKLIPAPQLEKMDIDARNSAGKKFESGLQKVAAPIQALMAISPLGGRRPYSPSPTQMKAPWPPAANAPSPKVTPAVRPEVPVRPSVALPSSSGLAPRGDAYKFSPKGGKEFLKKAQSDKNSTPDWVKSGAEFLKMKQFEKFLKDSEGNSNPLLRQLVRAGENLVHRRKTGKNSPIERGDLEKKTTNAKRPWLSPFDGPVER